MRQAATTVTVCFCLILASSAHGAGADDAGAAAGTIDRARRLIEAKDNASAASLLEDLLLEAGARERPMILPLLRQSYEALAHEAEAAGNERKAAYYRDNLAILNANRGAREPAREPNARVKSPEKPRSPAPTNLPAAQRLEKDRERDRDKTVMPAPAHAEIGRALEKPAAQAGSEPAALTEPPADGGDASGARDPRRTNGGSGRPSVKQTAETLRVPETRSGPVAVAAPPAVSEPPIVAAPESSGTRPSSEPESEERVPRMRSLDEGNRLFSAKKYEEAGQCYAALARENRLPADRINHWAYCRMVAVATRMNARPQSDREWTEIEAEIQSIQRLAPRLWYAEYLRNRLAEARKSRSRTPAKSDNLVVRGSAPDEDSGESRRLPRLFGKSRADAPPNRSDTESQVASDVADSKVEGAQRPVKLAADRAGGRFSPGGRGEPPPAMEQLLPQRARPVLFPARTKLHPSIHRHRARPPPGMGSGRCTRPRIF